MKKMIALLLLSAGTICTAQISNYQKNTGTSSSKPGPQTYYYNSNGTNAGRSQKVGGNT